MSAAALQLFTLVVSIIIILMQYLQESKCAEHAVNFHMLISVVLIFTICESVLNQ